jgi:hypothetical protein
MPRRHALRLTFQDRGQACRWWDIALGTDHVWRVVACEAEQWLWLDTPLVRASVRVGKAPAIRLAITTRAVPTAIPVVTIARARADGRVTAQHRRDAIAEYMGEPA